MRSIALSFLLLLTNIALSSVPHLPVYDVPEEYSSLDRVIDGGKVFLKSMASIYLFKSALCNAESFLDEMPRVCHAIKETRQKKSKKYSERYATATTYATYMPRKFVDPISSLLFSAGLFYVSYRLAKSAWYSFRQATHSASVNRPYVNASRTISRRITI